MWVKAGDISIFSHIRDFPPGLAWRFGRKKYLMSTGGKVGARCARISGQALYAGGMPQKISSGKLERPTFLSAVYICTVVGLGSRSKGEHMIAQIHVRGLIP